MSSTPTGRTIVAHELAIDRQALQLGLCRLASLVLMHEAKGESAIGIRLAVDLIIRDNDDAEAMWRRAMKEAQDHRDKGIPRIKQLRSDLKGRRIIIDQPQTPNQ